FSVGEHGAGGPNRLAAQLVYGGGDVGARSVEGHAGGVGAGAGGLERHFFAEALGPSHAHLQPAEALGAPVIVDYGRAQVQLSTAGVRFQTDPRIIASAGDVSS